MPPWLRILLALPLPLYSPVLHAQALNDDTSSIPLAPPALPPQFIVQITSPHSAEIADTASGLSISASNVAGRGVLLPGETFVSEPLTPRNSWRRRVEIGFAPTGLEDIGLVLQAVVTDDRQPWQFGNTLSHGVTAAARWQQNQTSAFTVKFHLLDSRLRYSGGISTSRYGEARVSANLTPDNPLYRQPRANSSTMQWHRVDARLWDGTGGKASAWFSYADVGQGFRSLQPSLDMPFEFDGRTMEFGTNLAAGTAKLSVTHRDARSVHGHSLSTKGTLTLGPTRFSMSRVEWSTGGETGLGEWQSRSSRSKATARVSLRGIFGPGKLAAILPDAVTLKLSRSRRESGRPDGLALVDSSKLGAELERARGNSATRIGFARGVTHRLALPGGAASRIDETWLDFSHSVTGEEWDLVAYGSVNLRQSARRSHRFYTGGMSLSLGGGKRPKLTVGIDADYFASRGDIAAFDVANQGVNISATADFSHLLDGVSRDRGRYLRVKAFTDWSRIDIHGEPGRGEMVPTVLAEFGTRF